MAIYKSFEQIFAVALKGEEDKSCPQAKQLYVIAGQFAAQMMTKGYDSDNPPLDRSAKLRQASQLIEKADLTCHTDPTQVDPKTGEVVPKVVQAGLGSGFWIGGVALAVALYALWRR